MLPEEFKERMKVLLKDEYQDFINSFEEKEVKSIRVNTNKISVDEFKKISPFQLEKIPYTEDGFYVEENSLGNHPYHHAGLFYVQDPSAMMTFNAIDLKDDYLVLDLCAAPGGKSTQIASSLKNGILIANEINSGRARILHSNIERLGFTNTIILNNDAYTLSKKFPNTFDAIFIDAPCSGEGMFRKNDEAIKTWSKKKIIECEKIQQELLKHANKMLKPGGYIIYSTCTYSLEENEKQITRFLTEYPYKVLEVNKKLKPYTKEGYVDNTISKELKKSVRFYPHISKGEGQFICVLQKTGVLEKNNLEFKTNTIIDKYIKNDIDITLNTEIINNKCYTKLPIDLKGTKVISSGVKLGEIKKDRFIYDHNFVTAYGKHFKNRVNLDVDDIRIEKYLKGYEITVDNTKDGYGVLQVSGYPLGLFKATNNTLKNHYPKGLRKH